MVMTEKTVIEVELSNNDIKHAISNYLKDLYDLKVNYEFDQLKYHIKDNTLFTAKYIVDNE